MFFCFAPLHHSQFLPAGGCTPGYGGGAIAITCVNASFYFSDSYTSSDCTGVPTRTSNAVQACAPGYGGQPAIIQSCAEGAFAAPPGSIVQEAVIQTAGCPATALPVYTTAIPIGVCLPISDNGKLQYATYNSNSTSVYATLHNASSCGDAPLDSQAFPLGCSAQAGDASAAAPRAAWLAPLAAAGGAPPARRAAAANGTAAPTLSPTATPTFSPTLSPSASALLPASNSSTPSRTRTRTGSNSATASPSPPAPPPAYQTLVVWSVVPASAPAAASTSSATVVSSALGGSAIALALVGGAAFYVRRARAVREDASKPLLRASGGR